MLDYQSGGKYFILNMFRCSGSVFPKTMLIGVIGGCVAFLMNLLFPDRTFMDGIMSETQAWSGFSFLLGFLIVFRTQQAYSRFWEGCTCAHRMRAEWFDAVSSVVAFTKHSHIPEETLEKFRELLVRLVSMLHAAALAELEAGDAEGTEQLWAHHYDIIDPDSLDEQSLATIQHSTMRVELLFQWIQELIVDQIHPGVLNIPPPILSRAFQEFATGMVAFHDAMKISHIPFPFPYAQACDGMLLLHWLLVPVITSQWVTHPVWAALLTFIQIWTLWSLNLIAIEIDKPFGKDPNDIDGEQMQKELNGQLWLLLEPSTLRVPTLIEVKRFESKTGRPDKRAQFLNRRTGSFGQILNKTYAAPVRLSVGSEMSATGSMQPRSSADTLTWAESMNRRGSNASIVSLGIPSVGRSIDASSDSSKWPGTPGSVRGAGRGSLVSEVLTEETSGELALEDLVPTLQPPWKQQISDDGSLDLLPTSTRSSHNGSKQGGGNNVLEDLVTTFPDNATNIKESTSISQEGGVPTFDAHGIQREYSGQVQRVTV